MLSTVFRSNLSALLVSKELRGVTVIDLLAVTSVQNVNKSGILH
uniref:Uncharacterized protein n=1 Tax=Anguilla anguilla TaxID=7936 RepID=A0A0E9TWP6_ANGAN